MDRLIEMKNSQSEQNAANVIEGNNIEIVKLEPLPW